MKSQGKGLRRRGEFVLLWSNKIAAARLRDPRRAKACLSRTGSMNDIRAQRGLQPEKVGSMGILPNLRLRIFSE